MDPNLRKSWPARVTAIGFIIVILAGNAWLCFAMLGIPVHDVVTTAFGLGISTSLLGGIGLVALTLIKRLRGPTGQAQGED